MPRGVLWFIFNLRIKNRLFTYTKHNYTCYILILLFFCSAIENLYILERLKCVSIAANESILASIPQQTDSHLPTMWPRTLPRASHADDLAWLTSAWLAYSLLQIKVPNSRICKSHWYTSPQSNCIQRNIFSLFHIFMSKLKRACWAWINSVGHKTCNKFSRNSQNTTKMSFRSFKD
jgi:hypothetical protein